MTTEHGMPSTRKVADHIAILHRRLDYLSDLPGDEINSWDKAEMGALQWALPVLEAEQSHLLRLRARLRERGA